jgi:hypothetical protein
MSAPQYLYQFANEAAWKEDHRRLSNGELSYIRLAGFGLDIGNAKILCRKFIYL